MRRSRPALVLIAGALWGSALLASCTTSKPPGELVVVVTTNLSVPKDIDTLRVSVSLAGGQTLLNHDYALGPSGLSLPGTLGVVSGPNTTAPVTIQVSGLLKGERRVSREAIATVPTDRVATLPMPLDWLCIGASCLSGETCRAGTCVSAKVPAIPNEYAPASGYDGGAQDGGGACFDTSACFASPVLWGAPFRADCTVSRPIGAADVNVALLVVGGAGVCRSGSCLVPLDAESPEGWRTSPDGGQIDLPPAVCTNGAVAAVEVTTACPTKRANAAICPSGGVPKTDGRCAVDADGGCPEGYFCEASADQGQCVLIDSGTRGPRCMPDSTVLCMGGATGYSCKGAPDPSLRCAHSIDCASSGLCCVSAGDAGTCPQDAGAAGDLIDDMSGQATGSCGGPRSSCPYLRAAVRGVTGGRQTTALARCSLRRIRHSPTRPWRPRAPPRSRAPLA